MNRVELIGNLTRDPELRYTRENKPVCSFTLAINRTTEGVDYIDISVWNKQAEICKKYLVKGRKIAIEGSIRTRTYEKDDKKVFVTEIEASNIEFLESKKENNESNTNHTTSAETNNFKNEPVEDVFADFGASIEISDEEINF